jgi:CDP-paratose 2-epimerase
MTFEGRRVLITGGAGFIGSNLARRVLDQHGEVVLVDDLSRAGVTANLRRLQTQYGGRKLRTVIGDVRDPQTVRNAIQGIDHVFHFAAQVAVTTSVVDPLLDHSVNVGGTLNVLEEIRRLAEPPTLLFTSTNKVYGHLGEIPLGRRTVRYEPLVGSVQLHGIDEDHPLSFCSPYGCSKGAADQYVLDAAQTFGLRSTVFRMSCIYGPQQCGNEDQGWLAHFLLRSLSGQPISIFGDGMQVRDVLYIDDLVDAFELTVRAPDRVSGRAFNIGGGPTNAVSLLEVIASIETLGGAPEVDFHPWRVADQRWYVSDTRRFRQCTGWNPRVTAHDGIARLRTWLQANVLGSVEVA